MANISKPKKQNKTNANGIASAASDMHNGHFLQSKHPSSAAKALTKTMSASKSSTAPEPETKDNAITAVDDSHTQKKDMAYLSDADNDDLEIDIGDDEEDDDDDDYEAKRTTIEQQYRKFGPKIKLSADNSQKDVVRYSGVVSNKQRLSSRLPSPRKPNAALSNAHHIRNKSSHGASLALHAFNSDRDRGYGSDGSEDSRISQSYGAYLFDANYKSKMANGALRARLAPQSSDFYNSDDEQFEEEEAYHDNDSNTHQINTVVRSTSVTMTQSEQQKPIAMPKQSTLGTAVRPGAASLTAFSRNGYMTAAQRFIVAEDVKSDDNDNDIDDHQRLRSPSLHRGQDISHGGGGGSGGSEYGSIADMTRMRAEVVLQQNGGSSMHMHMHQYPDDHEEGKDDEKEGIDVILSDAWRRGSSSNKPISTTPIHADHRTHPGLRNSGTQHTLSFARRSVILEDKDDDDDDDEDDDDVVLVFGHADIHKAYNTLDAHSSEDDHHDAHDISAVMQHDVMSTTTHKMRTFINGVKRPPKSKKSKTKTKTTQPTNANSNVLPSHLTAIMNVSSSSESGAFDVEEELKMNELADGDDDDDDEVVSAPTTHSSQHRAQRRRIMLLQNINSTLKQTIQNQAQQITHFQTEKSALQQQCDRYKTMAQQQPITNGKGKGTETYASQMDALRRQVLSLQDELNVTKHKLLQYEIFDENSDVDIHALLNDANASDHEDTNASDENGANSDGDGDATTCSWPQLENYIATGDTAYVERLIKARRVSMHDVDDLNCYRMLESATRHNQLEIVHKIISSHMGVKLGNKLLCYRHDNKHYAGYTILMIAVTNGYLEVANDLLDYYEYHSLSYTDSKIFEYLNLTDRNGVTLLMKACQIGNVQIISWVLNQYFGHKIQLKTIIEAKDAAGDDFHAYIESQAIENIINEYSPLIKG